MRFVGPVLDDKNMFVTSGGYIGLGQQGFRCGDLACVSFGGEVSFLLRPLNRRQTKLMFLSECYVHGVMDGEAMIGSEGRRTQSFKPT